MSADDYDSMSKDELRREVERLKAIVDGASVESFKQRIYIDFVPCASDTPHDALPDRRDATFGPFLSLEFSQGDLYVYDTKAPYGGQDFILATMNGTFWNIHDGSDEEKRYSMRVNTFAPPTRPKN